MGRAERLECTRSRSALLSLLLARHGLRLLLAMRHRIIGMLALVSTDTRAFESRPACATGRIRAYPSVLGRRARAKLPALVGWKRLARRFTFEQSVSRAAAVPLPLVLHRSVPMHVPDEILATAGDSRRVILS